MSKNIKVKFRHAKKKLDKFLKNYDMEVGECDIKIVPELDTETFATRRYPNLILLKRKETPETLLQRELIHFIQKTLRCPDIFVYVYTVLAEGLADFITKTLYSRYKIKYPIGYKIVELLFAIDDKYTITNLFNINSLPLIPNDVSILMKDERVHSGFKELIKPQKDMIKNSIDNANKLGELNPLFIPHGVELKTWKFLRYEGYDKQRERLNKLIDRYYKQFK